MPIDERRLKQMTIEFLDADGLQGELGENKSDSGCRYGAGGENRNENISGNGSIHEREAR